MRIRLGMILLASFSLAAAPLAQDKSDSERFQGVWTYDSVEIEGVKSQPESIRSIQARFVGDEVTIVNNDVVLGKGVQKLDPAKSPKELEVAYTDGPNKGKTFVGIYKIDGDTLTACFGPDDKTRPKDFTSTPGSNLRVVVLKRAKP
jgi:uncharacterized protein (TIGR03067 family)